MSAISSSSITNTFHPQNQSPAISIKIEGWDDLFQNLVQSQIIDSQGVVLKEIEQFTLPDKSLARLHKLRHRQFNFCTRDKFDPLNLGTTTIHQQLEALHAPALLVGSKVWEILGKEFFVKIFDSLGYELSEPFLERIMKRVRPHDVDVKLLCDENPLIFLDGKNLITKTLLAGKFVLKGNDEEYLKSHAFLKTGTIYPDELSVESIGSNIGFIVEYVFSMGNLRPFLCTLSGISLSFDTQEIFCPKKLLQCTIDFVSEVVRTDNYSTIDNRGFCRLISYLVLGYKMVDSQLVEILLNQLLNSQVDYDQFPEEFFSLVNHCVMNHLSHVPNAHFQMIFQLSYLLARKIPNPIFCQLWKKVKDINYSEEDEITHFVNYLAKSPNPLPFFHLLQLDDNGRSNKIVPPVTYSEFEDYCKNPLPLILEHTRYGHFKRSCFEILFTVILKIDSRFVLWSYLEKHIKEPEKENFIKRLYPGSFPRGLSINIEELFKPSPSTTRQALLISASDQVTVVSELTPQEMMENNFQELILLGQKEPATASSRIQQALCESEPQVNWLESHALLAELILVGLSLKNPISKQPYGLSLDKVPSVSDRLDKAYKLHVVKFPFLPFTLDKIVVAHPYDKESDKRIKILVKNSTCHISSNALILWMNKLKSSDAFDQINAWLEYITQSSKCPLEVTEEAKQFIKDIFGIPQISFTNFDKLKRSFFLTNEDWQFFYEGSRLRKDKGIVYFRWECLLSCDNEVVLNEAISSFTLEEAEKLIDEAHDKKLPLANCDTPELQKYCDTLSFAILRRLKSDGKRHEGAFTEIYVYINQKASELRCHKRLAELYVQFLSKKNGLYDVKLDFSKFSNFAMKLEIISLYDQYNIPYQEQDISEWIASIDYNEHHDQALRRHIPYLKSAPCKIEVLARWVETVAKKGDKNSKKEWLALLAMSDIGMMMNQNACLVPFGASLPLAGIDANHLVKFLKIKPQISYEDNYLYLDPLLESNAFLHSFEVFEFVAKILELGSSAPSQAINKRIELKKAEWINKTCQFFTLPDFYSSVDQTDTEQKYLQQSLTYVLNIFFSTSFPLAQERQLFGNMMELYSSAATRVWFDFKHNIFQFIRAFYSKYTPPKLLAIEDNCESAAEIAEMIKVVQNINEFFYIFVDKLLQREYTNFQERFVLEACFKALVESIPYHQSSLYKYYHQFVLYGEGINEINKLCYVTCVRELTKSLDFYLTQTTVEMTTANRNLSVEFGPRVLTSIRKDLANIEPVHYSLVTEFLELCCATLALDTPAARYEVFKHLKREETTLFLIQEQMCQLWMGFFVAVKENLFEIWDEEKQLFAYEKLDSYFRDGYVLLNLNSSEVNRVLFFGFALRFLRLAVDNPDKDQESVAFYSQKIYSTVTSYIEYEYFRYQETEFLEILNLVVEKFPFWFTHTPHDMIFRMLWDTHEKLKQDSSKRTLALIVVKWVKTLHLFCDKDSLEKLMIKHGAEKFVKTPDIARSRRHLTQVLCRLADPKSMLAPYPSFAELLPQPYNE